MANINKIEFAHFTWTDIAGPTEANLQGIRETYNFHPLDIADCMRLSKRSKVDIYPDYIFLVLLLPLYNRANREIIAAEINFFIGPNFLITVHRNQLKVFTDFVDLLRLTTELRGKYDQQSPERIVMDIVAKLQAYTFPIIDHLVDDCDRIQKEIFAGHERQMVSEILLIRRNISDTRKVMQMHKSLFKKAAAEFRQNPRYMTNRNAPDFDGLIETTKELWEALENLNERIIALQQTNESRISFKISDVMRILTTISFMTLPATLLAAIFGMNAINAMPFITHPYGFWIIVAMIAVIVTVLALIFKKKGWF